MRCLLLTLVPGNTLMGRADGAPHFLLLGMQEKEREVRVEMELELPFFLCKESSISNSPCWEHRLLGELADDCSRLKMTLKDIQL